MLNKPTIHILGAGALGSLWAAKLSKKNNVVLILKDKLKDNTHTFWLTEQSNTIEIPLPCETINNTSHINVLLVFTKSYDTLPAISQLQHRLKPSSQVILFQNGMGSQQDILKLLPHHPIYAASTTEGANRPSKDTVIYAGKGETWLGLISRNQTRHNQTAQLTILLSSSTLKVISTPDIWQRLWIKLAINCAINPFTALLNCQNGEIRDHELFSSRIMPLCQELTLVMSLNKIELSAEFIKENVDEVLKKTANNISSMLQDIRAGKQTEIEFINGYIDLVAREHGISLPINLGLLEDVRQESLIKSKF